jgi:hypothetical protein
MAGQLKITCWVEHDVLWCEAGHTTDGCPCHEPGHESLRCGTRERGPLSSGLSIMEGEREIGMTGEWMMLAPRLYTIYVKLADGKPSSLCQVEVLDQDSVERTVLFT